MSFIEDCIKIKYIREGYITKPYPHHLISREELIDAFFSADNYLYETEKQFGMQTDVPYEEFTPVEDFIWSRMTETEIRKYNHDNNLDRLPGTYVKLSWTAADDASYSVYIDDLEHPGVSPSGELLIGLQEGAAVVLLNATSHIILDGVVSSEVMYRSIDTVYTSTDYDITRYFCANYPCPALYREEYQNLVSAISEQLATSLENDEMLPYWIYSYMGGWAISDTSSIEDRHDLFVLLNADNLYDTFNDRIYGLIYGVSSSWIARLDQSQKRPPTIFGEPHVIKSLRT